MKPTLIPFKPKILVSAMAVAMLAGGLPPLQAATITADPLAQDAAAAGDTLCSLREAVLSINAGADVGDCVADLAEPYGSNDTIILAAGAHVLSIVGKDETYDESWVPGDPAVAPTVVNVPDATIGDLDISKSVRILGAGADITTVQWDDTVADDDRDRLFHILADAGTVDVTMAGMTLTGGRTQEVRIGDGPPSVEPGEFTTYYLRRAGGALALGPAAAVVLQDPNIEGQENSEGRGGSKRPEEPDEGGATYSLTLAGLVVVGNAAGGDGGGIYTAAPTRAGAIVVRDNEALTNGGGIYNEGNTEIGYSTVSGNIAEGGGGLFLTGSNTVDITSSTLNANRAVGGGALSGRAGVTINMVNSTVSANLAADVGAGVYTNGLANLTFVTIANNISGGEEGGTQGSGVNAFPAASAEQNINLHNVLLAANKKGWLAEVGETYKDAAIPAPDAAGLLDADCGTTGGGAASITSLGNNLSSDLTCATWLDPATNDIQDTDPLIGELADNGGQTVSADGIDYTVVTWTHALLAGSPALGNGLAVSGITVDQRGVTRDAVPDIGAYEVPTVDDGDNGDGGDGDNGDAVNGGGGGGCSVGGTGAFDPTLPAVVAAVLAFMGWRRRSFK
jgi:hypothetical protein